MLLFAVILLIICAILGAIVFWMELSIINHRLLWLEERLDKLEKDAVKVTFTGEPHYHGVRTTREDVDKILNNKPLVEGETKSQSKGDTGKTQAAPPPKPPKVLGEWQTKNGSPLKNKRKPKT